jgi:hypothetical protein
MTPDELELRKRKMRGLIDAEIQRRREITKTYRGWQEVDVSDDITNAEWVELDLSTETPSPRTPLQGSTQINVVDLFLFLGAFLLGLVVARI